MSAAQNPTPITGQAEELLTALEGVASAHVVTEPGGRIVEIHVLATPDFHPKQVVRNVESALRAGLGLEIDRRIVSVAQIRTEDREPRSGGAEAEHAETDEAPEAQTLAGPATAEATGGASSEPQPQPGTARRLEYVRFHAQRDAGSCTCDVVLRDDQREVTGTGAGPDTPEGRAEAASRAVLDAIARARPRLRLALAGAVLSRTRGRTFVIVAAHALQDRGAIALAGAAPILRSPEEAAILAALQATNRWSA